MTPGEWIDEIDSAKKREKDYRKDGEEIWKIYEGEKKCPFNILYSNTETLLPSLYSAVPRPIVSRRFKDNDPLGKAASEAGERTLSFLLDTNIEGYETFDDGITAAVLDGLLPGRGITAVKYDAEVISGEIEYKDSEMVCLDHKQWNRVYFGEAKKWEKVPWICYEEYIDKDEAIRLFGEEKAQTLTFSVEKEQDEEADKQPGEDRKKVTQIYQVWYKKDRTVFYLSPNTREVLRTDEDPLGLAGFYNTPKPIAFLEKNDLKPGNLYSLYENQAKELNELTNRINRIVKAIKARGIYDGELGEELADLMDSDDNTLVPADKSSSLAAERGLDNAIWFMPIGELIATLQQLYQAREAAKQVVYEITGIADIIRGSSKASETLGAQQIKEKWGGLRLRRLQKEVQRYVRDLLRMMLELASKKFSEETFAKMSGLPYLTTMQAQQLQQIMLASQAVGRPVDPQMQARAAQPKWADVLNTLRNDQQRAYRIDIETNSTLEPEAVQDQKDIADLLNAMGQYLNGVAPLVIQGVMPFEAAKSMLMAISRRFRFGDEIEDEIQAMQPPQQDNSEEQRKALEAEKQQVQLQNENERLKTENMQAKASVDLIKREAAVMAKEGGMKALEDRMKILEQISNERASDREKMQRVNQSATDKVRTAQEAVAQKDLEASKMVAQQVGGALQQMSAIVENLVASQAQMLQALGQQALKNEEMLGQMIATMGAPRRNRAIRGDDGRIIETISETIQ